MADDISLVRGRHQMSFGGERRVLDARSTSDNARAARRLQLQRPGDRPRAGRLPDRAGSSARAPWRARTSCRWTSGTSGCTRRTRGVLTDRITLNVGLRWEPYFGRTSRTARSRTSASRTSARRSRRTVFHNAPAGLIYPGDPGFPRRQVGLNTQWWNLSPRVGRRVGRHTATAGLAVRSSYGMNYDFPSAVSFITSPASASPFANRLRVERRAVRRSVSRTIRAAIRTRFRRRSADDAQYPGVRRVRRRSIPDINSTRVQSWNVTVEQQIGDGWQASASYLGSYSDRMWGQVAHQSRQFPGTRPLHHRRRLVSRLHDDRQPRSAADVLLAEPDGGAVPRPGRRACRRRRRRPIAALKLSFRRRAASGVSLSGNYTVSHCVGRHRRRAAVPAVQRVAT